MSYVCYLYVELATQICCNSQLFVPSCLEVSLYLNQFSSCLALDEDKRSTIVQLSKHPFISLKILNNPSTTEQKSVRSKDEGSSGVDNTERQLFMPIFRDSLLQGKSRLLNEFDTLEWLGKGGFGSVIKVPMKRFIFIIQWQLKVPLVNQFIPS